MNPDAQPPSPNEAATAQPKVSLNFHEPDFLRDYQIPDGCCLMGDYHFVRGDFVVLAGAPGVGKSMAATAAALCGASLWPWFGYTVHQRFKTMIFQNENGLIRLKNEYSEIGELIDPYVLVSEPPEEGLAFGDPAFRSAAKKALAYFRPDLVIIDPWSSVAGDDKQKDYSRAFWNVRQVIPATINSPCILLVAHTRKPRFDERSSGRALLNLVAGSYLLGATPRSVFVLQHATERVEEERVVLTCCKNNNGRLGPRHAWRRNKGGVFDEVKNFDWSHFDSNAKTNQDQWREVPAVLLEIGNNCPKAVLAHELAQRYAIQRVTAYRWIRQAGGAALIRFNKHTQQYYAPEP
jgi:hypothetical protein